MSDLHTYYHMFFHIMEMNYETYEYRVQLFDAPISVIARPDQLLHTPLLHPTKDTDGDQ